MEHQIVWSPQRGPQKSLVDCPIPIILWGGARGGGKTDGVLGKYAIKAARYPKHFNAVIFRQELPQADDLIERAREIYEPLGARFNKVERQFTFKEGARLRFRPLERESDAQKYQGQNISDATIEEAGNYADPSPIWRLFGALRSKDRVPIQLILTANPGGAGHGWIKEMFIDPAPQGLVILKKRFTSGNEISFIYIPSRVSDNKILLASDPGFIDRLELTGSAELVRAWKFGDWSAVLGAYFDCFRLSKHVIEPFHIPDHWMRFCCLDWGTGGDKSDPFAVVWLAVADGSDGIIPRESLIVYREWYGKTPQKIWAEDLAKGIQERESERIIYRVAGADLFDERGGPSLAERVRNSGLSFRRADTTRLAGWDEIRSRLNGTNGIPRLYIFHTCIHLIRTLPLLQHDPKKPMDVAPGDDHLADALRYGCMARPWVVNRPTEPTLAPVPTQFEGLTYSQLLNKHLAARRARR